MLILFLAACFVFQSYAESLADENKTITPQEFVKSVMGSISYDGYSAGSDAICHQSYTDEPCKQYVDRCKSK